MTWEWDLMTLFGFNLHKNKWGMIGKKICAVFPMSASLNMVKNTEG